MSDISPLLTKVASGSTAAAQNAQALGVSGAGVFAAGLGGGNFWDIIIAQFAAGLEGDKPKSGTGLTNNPLLANAAPEAKAPVKTENPLALLQIALASQTLDADGNVVISAPETDPAKLQSQLEMTNTIINQIKALIPDTAEKEGMFANLLGKLQSKSDTLQASLSALENPVITKETPVEEIPMPLLIALGLTPSEISKMTERLQSLEKKLGRDITVEDLIAGVGGLIPPAPETPAIALASLKTAPAGAAAGVIDTIDENTQPTDDLAAKLNAMDVGGAEQTGEDPLEDTTKKLFDAEVTDKPDPSVTDGKVKKSTMHFRENLVNMLNTHKSQQGQMLFPAGAFAADTDAQIYQQFGLAPASGLSFGTTAQAASLVSSPALAGQAHPASQMVAATMIKAGKNGDGNVMTLRLDPPELGNVSIRLQFGKDKMVKAVITAEKPETYMMLQRDSHALERALQSAGLETGSDSLSFQLSDNGTFAHDNNGKGANDSFGGGKAGPQNADAADIIQSSVTWQVDPSTGHVRYNIFA
jgi:flagellar hook-length control protein FliK